MAARNPVPDDPDEAARAAAHPPTARHIAKGASINRDGLTRTEAQVRRRIGEQLRELHTAEEFGTALWAIFEGRDPFKKKATPRPDGVPEMLGNEPLKWEQRIAAGKLYAEYAWGKPLQGVVVEAQVEQRIQVEGQVTTGPIDFMNMPPAVRDALRIAALGALGRPLPARAIEAPRVLDVHVDAEQVAPEPREQAVASDGETFDLDSVLGEDVDGQALQLESAPRGGLELGVEQGVGGVETAVDVVAHDHTVVASAPAVKGIRLDFPTSTNLVDAALEDGILTVRFRTSVGPPRVFRYRNVTPAMMATWRQAPSAGAWFAREIRQRHQQYPVIPQRAALEVLG